MSLYNGDCLELLKGIPDNSIDLVVTDPPYMMTTGESGGAFGKDKRAYHNEIDPLTKNFNLDVLDELVRVLKKINIYIWCSKDQLRQYIDYFEDRGCKTDLLCWHKTNPTPTCNSTYLSDTEYLLFFREKGVKVYGTYHSKKKFYVSPTNKEDKKLYGHPTIKPLEIIENLIINSSCVGDTVLDCFMGSGTTGVACVNTGRKFIGMELGAQYFNTATERINKAKSAWLDNLLGGAE